MCRHSDRSVWHWCIGLCVITQRGNQNRLWPSNHFIALGATVILGPGWFRQGGRTRSTAANGRAVYHIEAAFACRNFADIPILWLDLFATCLVGIFSADLSGLSRGSLSPGGCFLIRNRSDLRLPCGSEIPGGLFDPAGSPVTWMSL